MAYGRQPLRESMPRLPVSVHFLIPTSLGRRSFRGFVAWNVFMQQTVGFHERPATREIRFDVVAIGKVGD
jgi:hypothetical protein